MLELFRRDGGSIDGEGYFAGLMEVWRAVTAAVPGYQVMLHEDPAALAVRLREMAG